ncbi:unnamed protein product [Trichogramma brassicae]|uniref:Uncharacterized protein n=1 Tax=Trichogramma brassicae TaxID=86971 RepID=A0A6H5ITB2_9HYME|nr:unnamed protein product [Trichogramma brassicae]
MSKIIGCFSFLARLSEDPDWVDFLRELKREHRQVADWNCREQRRDFLGRFDGLIRDWHGQLPDLRDIFRRRELELLLRDTIECYGHPAREEAEIIVRFIARAGYRHKYRYDKRDGKPLRILTTPLHLAAKRSNMKGWDSVVEALFKIYNGFDCNYEERSTGLTHFHVACMSNRGHLVRKFLDVGGCDPNLLAKTGESPLQLACKRACKQTIELLLRKGAEPNYADKDGSTPLHMICGRAKDQEGVVEMFFRMCDEMQREVKVDARDAWSNTPLNLALLHRNKEATEVLLRRGACPKQVDKEGLTPLHFICRGDDVKKKEDEVELIEVFFKVLDDIGQTAQLDAGNKDGNRPLHFALSYFNKKATEILLRRGANPNATNARRETPLHIICCCGSSGESHEIAKLFFEICDELKKRVELDAVNSLGHCALQLAVANPDPDLLDLLLDRGARVPDTFYPPGSYFDRSFEDWGGDHDFKLWLAADAMCCIERLEARTGRAVDRSRAPLIMTLIAEYEALEKGEKFAGHWWDDDDDDEFAVKAKEIRVNEELSLYELILLPDEEAAKRVTYEDYREFARANKLWLLEDEIYQEACAMRIKVHEGRKDFACDKSSIACKYSFYNLMRASGSRSQTLSLLIHTVARSCCAFSHRAPSVNCFFLFAARARACPPSAARRQLCCFRPLLFQRWTRTSLAFVDDQSPRRRGGMTRAKHFQEWNPDAAQVGIKWPDCACGSQFFTTKPAIIRQVRGLALIFGASGGNLCVARKSARKRVVRQHPNLQNYILLNKV